MNVLCLRGFNQIQTELIIFVFLIAYFPCIMVEANEGMVWFVRDYFEKVKVCEKCGGGRTIRGSVVLYFFLLRDAPSSPSVLIGSWEHPCAVCADVNRAWRTSAAGTYIPTSLLSLLSPVLSLLHNHLIWIWTIKSLSVVLTSSFSFLLSGHNVSAWEFLCCYQAIVSCINNWKDYSFDLHVWKHKDNSLCRQCKHPSLCWHGHFIRNYSSTQSLSTLIKHLNAEDWLRNGYCECVLCLQRHDLFYSLHRYKIVVAHCMPVPFIVHKLPSNNESCWQMCWL